MKLYILEKNEKTLEGKAHWDIYIWDCVQSMVIRAPNAKYARKIAKYATDGDEPAKTWLNPKLTTCKALRQEGEPGLILRDRLEG